MLKSMHMVVEVCLTLSPVSLGACSPPLLPRPLKVRLWAPPPMQPWKVLERWPSKPSTMSLTKWPALESPVFNAASPINSSVFNAVSPSTTHSLTISSLPSTTSSNALNKYITCMSDNLTITEGLTFDESSRILVPGSQIRTSSRRPTNQLWSGDPNQHRNAGPVPPPQRELSLGRRTTSKAQRHCICRRWSRVAHSQWYHVYLQNYQLSTLRPADWTH